MKTDMLRKIKAGDAISIDDVGGVVAFSSVTDSYSLTFPKSEWPDAGMTGSCSSTRMAH
ncbi:MAG: hypothetical protein AAF415_19930 [Pseudomonadota bacterium]